MGEPLPQGDPAGSLKRGVATIYQELDLVRPQRRREHLPRPRASPLASLLDLDKMYQESKRCLRGSARVDPGARQGEAAPRRAADRLDRASALRECGS